MAPAFKVLAVDGGGIRGIIPALILAEIEDRTTRSISDLFDLVAGTSTGGIVALGLVKPGPDGKSDKSARDIVHIYEQTGSTIFPQTFLEGLHLGLVRGAKYSDSGFQSVLKQQFGDARLKDALKPVIIPAYDIENQAPFFFKSTRAKASPDYDYAMRDVVRATAAAPTYFVPEKIQTADPATYFALVDGAMVAGNPAMCAYAEAIKMGQASGDVLMLSIGTGDDARPVDYEEACEWGAVEWIVPVLGMSLQGSNTSVDYQLRQILQPDGPQQSYFRLQVKLDQAVGGVDDASHANLKHLTDLTQAYLAQPETQDVLSRLCDQLTA